MHGKAESQSAPPLLQPPPARPNNQPVTLQTYHHSTFSTKWPKWVQFPLIGNSRLDPAGLTNRLLLPRRSFWHDSRKRRPIHSRIGPLGLCQFELSAQSRANVEVALANLYCVLVPRAWNDALVWILCAEHPAAATDDPPGLHLCWIVWCARRILPRKCCSRNCIRAIQTAAATAGDVCPFDHGLEEPGTGM